MAGILKRKKRLGRPRKSAKDTRTKRPESKIKSTKSKTSKSIKSSKSIKTSKSSKATKSKATKTPEPVVEEPVVEEPVVVETEAPAEDVKITKNVAKSKRGPGRPRKGKKNKKDEEAQDDKHTTSIIEKHEPPKKRGPGRPPKSKNKKDIASSKEDSADDEEDKSANVDSEVVVEDEPVEKAPKKRGPGRPRKKKSKDKTESKEKSKDSKKQPNPLLEIMDNFKDDKKSNDDDSAADDLGDFMSESLGADVMLDEESGMELMSNSDLDVDEIIKIDTVDSEELERELDSLSGISEKEQMKEDVAEMEKRETICPECGSTKLINDHERGEVVCGTCGLVIDDNIVDMGPEWRAFDHEQRDKRTRVGAPITYTIHDKGLSTMIDWRNKDIYGRDIPARNRAQWYRLRKWQRKIRISGATERNLAFALSELDRDSSRLGLPRSVRESASVVYRNAVENKLIRGRSIEGVVAASLYAACRRCKVPRTLDEIADVSRVSKKEVGRTYRFLTRELHIRLPPTSPIDYVPRFASELNLSGLVQSKAIEIINQAMDNGLTSGRGPTGVAAAALYIASVLLGERKTQRDVADIAGVTEVTIRNRYKELTEQLDVGVKL